MTKKNKIYFYHPYSGEGGADLSISRLINGLDHKKYEVDFLSLNYAKIRKKIKYKINYKIINSNRTFFSFNEINNYIEKDKNYKKKIFISNQNFANALSTVFLKKRYNLKLILFERNHISELENYKNFSELLKKNIIKLLIKFFYKKADIVLTNSKSSSRDLRLLSNANVKTLYNPCFFKLYKKKKKNKKKKIILNVSRFTDQKDHLTLLKGFKNSRYNNKFLLHLVGYGYNEYKIRKYIDHHNLNNIKIFKNKFKLNKFYKKADLFVLTSIYEGFPNVLVEAASFRIPIISSNFKSGASEILLNGSGGTIFKVKNYKELSNKIDKFYLNEKSFLNKEKICANALYRFSNKKIIKDFNKIIYDLFK